MKSPVLCIIFNRPDTTRQVFEVLKVAKPPALYICAEGPRKNTPQDILLCQQARAVYDYIDWDCEIHRMYRDTNSGGCGPGVSGAINWFFDNVEEGIILEDDIIPHPDFFRFCDEMLQKYRNNPDIKCVCGSNVFYGNDIYYPSSYFFSHFVHIWGWATWKRSWKEYDYSLMTIPRKEFISKINTLPLKKENKRQAIHIYDIMTSDSPIDTWDYQLLLTVMFHHGLSIIPITNLCQNIGFNRNDATHTKAANERITNHKGRSIYPIKHPSKIKEDKILDEMMFSDFCLESPVKKKLRVLIGYIKSLIKRLAITTKI